MINDIDDLLELSSLTPYSVEKKTGAAEGLTSNIDNQFLKDRLHQCLNDLMREYDIAKGIRDTEMPYPYTFIVEVMIFLFVFSTPFLFSPRLSFPFVGAKTRCYICPTHPTRTTPRTRPAA